VTTSILRMETPEERELAAKRARLAELQAQLAQRELDLQTLRAQLHAFESRYLQLVASRIAELDRLRAQLAEARARADPDNAFLREEARRAWEQAQASARAARREPEEAALPRRFPPSEELKRLYREVARRLHPDLATNEAQRARRTRLMAEANYAFEVGDVARLQALLEEWELSPEAVEGEGIGAELVRVIRQIAQIERRLAAIERDMAELEATPLCRLFREAEAAEREGHDLLVELAAEMDAEIAATRQALAREFGGLGYEQPTWEFS